MIRPRATELDRALERELVRGLSARRRRSLVDRVRGNPDARRRWDRAISGIRALERQPVSQFELDQVERWLFEDLVDDDILEAGPIRARTWAWLGAGLVAALAGVAALAWWVGDRSPNSPNSLILDEEPIAIRDPYTPRSGTDLARPLALDPVCGQPPRPATDRGCELDELLGFSVRLGDEQLDPIAAAALARAPLQLTIFGISDAGDVHYYLPTPDELGPTPIELDSRWQPLPRSVRLAVNHQPGRVRVFALVGDAIATPADVDRLAEPLRSEPSPADVDTPAWHLRVDHHALTTLCPDLDRCRSAETEFWIASDQDLP